MLTHTQQWLGVLVVIAVIGIGAATLLPTGQSSENIAVLSISGTIGPGGSGPLAADTFTTDRLRGLIDRAEQRSPEGYIVQISSGGGTVVASRRVSELIQEIEEPTACVLGDTAASGAYWAALGCDRIIADRLTLTGSIGATMSYLEYGDLLDRYGIDYVNLTSGQLKDIGAPYTDITPEERQVFERILDGVEDAFVERVAERRNMSRAAAEQVANGTMFLGDRAAELGLVDATGDRADAVAWLESETGQNLTTVEISRPPQLGALSLFARHAGYGVGAVLDDRLLSAQGVRLRSLS